jgi:cell fate regulator YaaT (PSP1 superfamily)
MPGSIVPLPVMLEEDQTKQEQRQAEAQTPKTAVVRYGYQKLIAELPYGPKVKPGCGSRLVIRTDRGTEIATLLTSTCPNSGCGHSVSRQQMLDYIEKSGGKNYPFITNGRILRIATAEDMLAQKGLDDNKADMIGFIRMKIAELSLPMKLVEVERLLGQERVIVHYAAEQWVDFRLLVRLLAAQFQTRVEMRQVSAREEARLVADYERCGQHCCCKQFLKVLKPVPMRAAKIQKTTPDPSKISGRCGRLMCCLRYEQETYESLKKKLPNRNSRVMTDEGPGTVLDGQILTQLVRVKLDEAEVPIVVPVEELHPAGKTDSKKPAQDERQVSPEASAHPSGDTSAPNESTAGESVAESAASKPKRRRRKRRPEKDQPQAQASASLPGPEAPDGDSAGDHATPSQADGEGLDSEWTATGESAAAEPKRRRRRRRKPSSTDSTNESGSSQGGSAEDQSEANAGEKPKRRRRRRRKGDGGSGGESPSDPPSGPSSDQ